MTSRILALLVSIAILAATAPIRAGQAGDDPQFRVRIESSNVDALRAWLESRGYDVLGSDAANSTVDVAVSRAELHGLNSHGLSIVSIERGRPLEATTAPSATKAGEQLTTAAVVSAGYLNLAGINARLQQIADEYPDIAQLVDLTATYNAPPTFEARHIFALRISDNIQFDEDEPAMLVASTHHAREISTPVIALEAAARLTAGYGVDQQITNAVDAYEISDRPGLESRRLQLRLHDQQPVEKEPSRLLERGRRRPEPELPSRLELVVRRKYQRQLRDLQGTIGWIGSGDADDDGLVRE